MGRNNLYYLYIEETYTKGRNCLFVSRFISTRGLE